MTAAPPADASSPPAWRRAAGPLWLLGAALLVAVMVRPEIDDSALPVARWAAGLLGGWLLAGAAGRRWFAARPVRPDLVEGRTGRGPSTPPLRQAQGRRSEPAPSRSRGRTGPRARSSEPRGADPVSAPARGSWRAWLTPLVGLYLVAAAVVTPPLALDRPPPLRPPTVSALDRFASGRLTADGVLVAVAHSDAGLRLALADPPAPGAVPGPAALTAEWARADTIARVGQRLRITGNWDRAARRFTVEQLAFPRPGE